MSQSLHDTRQIRGFVGQVVRGRFCKCRVHADCPDQTRRTHNLAGKMTSNSYKAKKLTPGLGATQHQWGSAKAQPFPAKSLEEYRRTTVQQTITQRDQGTSTRIPTFPYLILGLLLVMAVLAWTLLVVMRSFDSLMQDKTMFYVGITVLVLGVALPTILAAITAARAGMHGASAGDALPVAAGKAALVIVSVLVLWTICALLLA